MIRRTVSFAIAALVAIGLAGPVSAESHMDKPSFQDADKDGNGTVSIKEAMEAGFAEDQAMAQDVNQDGELTEQDWKYISDRSNFVLYDVEDIE